MRWQALKLQCSVTDCAFFFAGANAMLPLDPTETVKVEKLEGRTTQVSQHKRTLGL